MVTIAKVKGDCQGAVGIVSHLHGVGFEAGVVPCLGWTILVNAIDVVWEEPEEVGSLTRVAGKVLLL